MPAGLKILLVAPGPRYCTFDVYRYYADALGRCRGVRELHLHDSHDHLQHHRLALVHRHPGVDTDPTLRREILLRASRDLFCDVWTLEPDVVLFVDGTQLPQEVFAWIHRLRSETRRRFLMAIYVTEAPYLDRFIRQRMELCDLSFVSERSVLEDRELSEKTAVHYVPHSYSRDVHYPAPSPQVLYDVYFCGSIYPERAKLLSSVDWTGIRTCFTGQWYHASPEDKAKLGERAVDGCRVNSEVARDYRRSRIVPNMHRRSTLTHVLDEPPAELPTEIDQARAWSMGPRVIEAAACGVFQVSDHRPEVVDVFGPTIPLYRTADELEHLIRRFLADEPGRRSLADQARERVRGMSYDDRAPVLVGELDEMLSRRRWEAAS